MILRMICYQMQCTTANVEKNVEKITQFYNKHKNSNDLIITPELSLCSYLPKDNLYYKEYQNIVNNGISKLQELTLNNNATLVIGAPLFDGTSDNNPIIYNTALVIQNGKIIKVIYKEVLPNFGVFNEHRYFTPKKDSHVVNINGYKVGIIICEDAWHEKQVQQLQTENADIIVSINASPFAIEKYKDRESIMLKLHNTCQIPAIYVNLVGGFDEIMFDGSSFVLNNGKVLGYAKHCTEDYINIELNPTKNNSKANPLNILSTLHPYESDKYKLIYQVLLKGMRDFVYGSGFKKVVVGLSGGIDSAFVATIACDALGSENVTCISLPSDYTSILSLDIIKQLKENLECNFLEIPITELTNNTATTIAPHISIQNNSVIENIQARIRAQILMAYTNANSSYMLLTTGNKSELAVGYCTIYGDTCGMFNVIKDVYKTDIFALAKWRNNNILPLSQIQKKNIIPEECIIRKPSAELKNNQFDEDTLMDYNTLDSILYQFIEKKLDKQEIYKQFDKLLVDKTIKLVNNSQYKRVQSTCGIVVSERPLGLDFQYPLTASFKL